MSWTKRQFIEQAYGEIGLADYIFDLEPEQLQNALRKLDMMMAQWNSKGIRLGYPMPSSPKDSDLDSDTGVTDDANEAIALNLAIRLAPGHGKAVSVETKAFAKEAYMTLLSKSTFPIEMQYPASLPYGAGNKQIDNRFFPGPEDSLNVGPDGELEFE